MVVHMIRVQYTKSQRQWWVKGDNSKKDLMKFKPHINFREARIGFENKYNCEILKFIMHKVLSHSEALVMIKDIERGSHAKME